MSYICKQLYKKISKNISLITHEGFDLDNIYREFENESKRAQEFRVGRFIASKALERFNQNSISIEKGSSGEPIWPKGICGSISHSKGNYFIGLGLEDDFRAIGVDVEHFNRIKKTSINRILHNLETDSIKTNESSATVLFSLKEAFYKAQFPLTKYKMNFNDMALNVCFDSKTAKILWLNNNLPIKRKDFAKWIIKFEYFENKVYSVVYLNI